MKEITRSRRSTVNDSRLPSSLSPNIKSKNSSNSIKSSLKFKDTKLLNSVSDSSLVKKSKFRLLMKKELQKLKNGSESEYKAGVSQVLELARISARNLYEISGESLKKLTVTEDFSKISPNRWSPTLLLKPLSSVANSVTRAGFKSRPGATNAITKSYHQSTCILKANLNNIKGQYVFSVCCGHGPACTEIINFINDNYIPILELFLTVNTNFENSSKAMINASEKLNQSLKNSSLDLSLSGATMISVLICENRCVCANLGNCSAFIARNENKWEAIPLNKVHDLSNVEEKQRLLGLSARIEKIGKQEFFGIGKEKFPLLETTRSYGDRIGKYVGLTHNAEIECYSLTKHDKFVIIASPAVWKVLTGIDAVCIARLGWENNRTDQSCQEITQEVERRYHENNEDMDDVSVVIVYIKVPE